MTIHLTFLTLEAADIAEAQIRQNCRWPSDSTERWAIPEKATGQELWFFPKPIGYSDGIDHFTQEEMMNGLTDYIEMEFQESWRAD